jgi:hypothetical protein
MGKCVTVIILIFNLWGNSATAEQLYQVNKPLLEKYHEIESELKTSSFGLPVHMESFVDSNSSHVDIYGIVNRPFDIVKNELQVPSGLCDIFILTSKIRACIYKKIDNDLFLTVYNVKRYFDPIESAFPIRFRLTVDQQQKQFRISLAANEGPFGTTDHQCQIEATPLDESTTFIRLHYFFSYSSFGYLKIKSYFWLFSRGKVGFTVVNDKQGNPTYVNGLRGADERSVMRYYLAILAYLDALGSPTDQRFEKRLTLWFDLTMKFKKQLFEMEKKDYLAYKRKDEKSQLQLQKLN